jgi:glycosyltransferase 2 family protein
MPAESAIPETESDLKASRRRPLYWLFSLPLAATLLYFALRGVDWRRVWHVASSANLMLIAGACAVASLSYLVRALRWRLLLGAGEKIGLATVFWSNSTGYMVNNFLPARTGEVLRSAMISARSGLSKTYVLTTALTERLVDALALMTISSVVLLTIDRKPDWLAAASKPFAVIGLGGAVTLVLLPRFQGLIDKLLARLHLPEKWRGRLTHLTGQVLLGIRSLHHGVRLAGFCSFTALIWFLDAASAVILARALGLHLGFPVALLMLTGIGLSSALPSTPGNVGVYQFVTVSVLAPFGFTHSDALAYSLIGQAIGYILVAFWGLIGVWRYNV